MQKLVFKRNITFYLSIASIVIIIPLCVFLIGTLLLDIHTLSVKEWIALVLSSWTIYAFTDTTLATIKYSPTTIYLNTQNIQFNDNEVYSLKSITSLNLDYNNFLIIRGIAVVPLPSIYIKFDNHVEKIIAVNNYNNIHFLKQALEQLYFLNLSTIELKSITLPSDVVINTPTTKIYSSLWFFNFRIIIMLMPILFLSFLSIITIDTTQIGWIVLNICILLLVLFLLVIIRQTQYYFEVNEEYLIVRNVLLFSKKHIYPLKDIKYLQICEDSRTPTGLRITLNSFDSYQYFASAYSDKHWEQLEKTLQQHKVQIK